MGRRRLADLCLSSFRGVLESLHGGALQQRGRLPEAFPRAKRIQKAFHLVNLVARFLRSLLFQHFGWWAAVTLVPSAFLDHHRCEKSMPYWGWGLYGATVLAMLLMALLLELTMLQRLGLLDELKALWEPKWRRPLASTVLWKVGEKMSSPHIHDVYICLFNHT